MSVWKVSSNMIAGKKKYSCYCIKDVNAADHSGNRKELGIWYENQSTAMMVADALNKADKMDRESKERSA
jgi:hypothetical protein